MRAMSRFPTAFVALTSLLMVAACGDNQDPEGANDLFQRLQDLDYRNTFAKPPGYDTRQPSNTAHSDFSAIFINDVAAAVLDAGEPTSSWPLDSLIVKDGTDEDGTLDLIAVMEKRSDGWYWAEYLDPESEDGGAEFSGKPDLCIDCHQVGADAGNDFTRAIALPK